MILFSIPIIGYDKELINDYKNLLKHLKSEYPQKYDSCINPGLKKIHKLLWGLYITEKTFNEKDIYFSDIFTNTLSYINILLLKDKKILEFLERSSIENFIKFSKLFFHDLNTLNAPRDIFSHIFSNCNSIEFVHKRYKLIKSKYSEISWSLHGNNIDSTKTAKQLKQCANRYSTKELLQSTDNYYQLIINFLEIYYYYNYNLLEKLIDNEQYILKDMLSKEWLSEIKEKIIESW